MRPIGLLGVVLIVGGGVVLALRGFSYTKERNATKIGPLEIAAEKKGFVPPMAGAVMLVAGAVLVIAGRGRGGQ